MPLPSLRSVTILGATGSIGRNTVDLLARAPEMFRVAALTASRNVDLLIEQTLQLQPELAVIADETLYPALRAGLAGSTVRTAAGAEGIGEAATLDCDVTVSAIMGAAGLAPTLAAIRRGGTVALANKECLVCAGEWVMREVRTHGATLLPVDSEHNAIFQIFDPAQAHLVEKLTLTASGGPFRTWTRDAMQKVTPEEAVRHPNWSMGAKISVDSATLMNKGLELIEAAHLFPIPHTQLDVVIHPESIIHGMAHYVDGSVLAQMSAPDMRTPLAHALAWPGRIPTPTARLDLAALGRLTFDSVDMERFPALKLAREALARGGNAPTILSAANEIAVAAFLQRQIGFLDIPVIVEDALDALPHAPLSSLEEVLECDASARNHATRSACSRAA